MAINKNFVIKHGVEVNTNLIVGDADTQKVGIGTTVPQYSLHVGGLRGGIGASDAYVSGVTTVRDLHVTGITTFDTGRVLIGAGASTGTRSQLLHVGSATTEGGVYISGDVGLGVTLPGAKLNVVPGSSAIAGLFSGTTEKDMVRITQLGGGNALRIDDIASDASPFVVTGIGSVGIGTTNPEYTLVVDSLVSTGTTALFVHGDAQITGDLIVDDFNLDELTVDQVNVTGILTSAQTKLNGITTAVNINVTGITTFNDDAALYFGDSQDLKIWHDGDGHSYIQETAGTGSYLNIDTNKLRIRNAAGDEELAIFDQDGAVALYFNDTKRLATTAIGATVFGDFIVAGVTTAEALNISGVSTLTSVGSNLIPDADGTRNIGAATSEWGDLFLDGTANIDALVADTAIVSDLTDNRVVIAGSSGELEDDSNFTFDGSQLNVGVGVATIGVNGNLAVAGIVTVGTALSMGDNKKAQFGDDGDLIIYGNSSASNIKDTTGDLSLVSNQIYLELESGTNIVKADQYGIIVTGVTTTNRLYVSGVSTFASIGSNLIPDADGSRNIGAATSEWGDLFIDGTANIDSLAADTAAIGDLTDNRVVIAGASGELEDDANFTFDGSKLNIGVGVATIGVNGNAAFAGIVTVGGNLYVTGDIHYDEVTGRNLNISGIATFASIGSNLIPDADGTRNIGAATSEWGDLYIDGTANIDTLDVDGTSNFADDVTLVAAGSSTILFDASAWSLIFQDNIRAKFGTGSDLEVFHDGSDSYITNTGTGNLIIKGDDVHIQGSNGDNMANFNEDAGVQLRYDGNIKITTDKHGTITTGISTADGFNVGDNEYITAGASDDLQLYHENSGNNSLIFNKTGDLYIQGNNGSGSAQTQIQIHSNAEVDLKYQGNIRITTTDDGADVSGTGSLKVPVGTTAQRNGSPADGDIRYNSTLNSYEGYGNSAWGGLGGGTEIDNIVVTASATGIGTFAHASYRSASVRVQIVQGSNYQVGRYLMIHDGTTVTVVEEAAIATGSMLGTIDGVIESSNAVLRVTMGSSSTATITTIIDKITV